MSSAATCQTTTARTDSDFASATVYQIYPKSFKDSNGDGFGDLPGVIEKLDYLRSLGVDYLWLTPFFPSPGRDNGYDVSDYRAIDPAYGTMADFERLVAGARERGMGIMLDMVLCHTSSKHEWFQRALAGEERYRRYYILRDGRGSTGPGDPGEPPTNWQAAFGGSMWEWEPRLGKWYLHMHDVSQPDLNWDNPEVRRECADVVRFWRDKGVSGFRFDVVSLISKPEVFEDDPVGTGRAVVADGPHVHEYLQELVCEAGIQDMLTVGEMASTTLENCILYTRPEDRELTMAFSFHHLKVDYKGGDKWSLMAPDIARLQELFATWQEGMQSGGGWNALFWDNHDQPRAVSRFCTDGELRVPAAKMLACVGCLMRGTPYVYQGDELAMTNAHFTGIDEYRDVESLNSYRILRERGESAAEALRAVGARSRDNGRTPMQWGSGHAAGFTAGEPWIPMARDARGCRQADITVEAEEADPASVLAFYRDVVHLRHELPVIATGKVRFLDAGAVPVIGYARFGELPVGERYDASTATDADLLAPGSLLVLGNFSSGEAPAGARARRLLAAGGWRVLLSGYGDRAGALDAAAADGLRLRPFEGLVLRRG